MESSTHLGSSKHLLCCDVSDHVSCKSSRDGKHTCSFVYKITDSSPFLVTRCSHLSAHMCLKTANVRASNRHLRVRCASSSDPASEASIHTFLHTYSNDQGWDGTGSVAMHTSTSAFDSSLL